MRILAFSDLHIGKSFQSYPPTLAKYLRDARFATLRRLMEEAQKEAVDLVCVAGDLFDHTHIDDESLKMSFDCLAVYAGTVVVLPGNHDHCDDAHNTLWSRIAEHHIDSLFLCDSS